VSEKTIGVTARHVLFSEGQTSDDKAVHTIELSDNGEYLTISEPVPYGSTSRDMQHEVVDVGCYMVTEPLAAEVNSLEAIGAIIFPSKDFSLQLWRSMVDDMRAFILAKYGCATKYTSGTIRSVGRARIDIDNRGYAPIAFHGDSGSLWIVIQSPADKFNGVIAGITTSINPTFDGDRIVGVSRCIIAPVWSWIDLVDKLVTPTVIIDTVIGHHVMKSLYFVGDIDVGTTDREPAERSISQRSAYISLLIPTLMFMFSWVFKK
jgi:hypothetical protein